MVPAIYERRENEAEIVEIALSPAVIPAPQGATGDSIALGDPVRRSSELSPFVVLEQFLAETEPELETGISPLRKLRWHARRNALLGSVAAPPVGKQDFVNVILERLSLRLPALKTEPPKARFCDEKQLSFPAGGVTLDDSTLFIIRKRFYRLATVCKAESRGNVGSFKEGIISRSDYLNV